jgi:hypothetical protein
MCCVRRLGVDVEHRVVVGLEDSEDRSANTEGRQSEMRALLDLGQRLGMGTQVVSRTHDAP